jgi:hypothetical protein
MKEIICPQVSASTITWQDIDLTKGLIVQVYECQVSILKQLTHTPTEMYGFCDLLSSVSWNTVTDGYENIKERIQKECGNSRFYLFDNLQEFAKAIIDNGWR